MQMLLFLSKAAIPFIILFIVGNGLLRHQRVYEDFLDGAGFLDFLADLLAKGLAFTHFPTELVPIAIVKMFSSSAATGLLLDLYKEHGTDSMIGLAASIMLSSTETIFYTMSIYFMIVKVKKTRYTLAGALIATLAGIAASVTLAQMGVYH